MPKNAYFVRKKAIKLPQRPEALLSNPLASGGWALRPRCYSHLLI